jgi:hypothetical protein
LDQWLPSTKTTSLSLFLWKLETEREYTPFGEQILTYELKEENRTPYLIHRVIPINNSYPWYAYYNLDVYAIWLLAFLTLQHLIKLCCCRGRRTLPSETSMKMKISS